MKTASLKLLWDYFCGTTNKGVVMLKRIFALIAMMVAVNAIKSVYFQVVLLPRMSNWEGVPLSWGMPIAIPFVLAALVVGYRAREVVEVPLMIAVATILSLLPFIISPPSVEYVLGHLFNELLHWGFWISIAFIGKKTIDRKHPAYSMQPVAG